MPLVEELSGDRQRRHRAEDVQQVLAVGVRWVRAKIQVVLVEGPAAPVAGAGQARRVDKCVVLQKTHEDAAENPGDGDLHQVLFAPGIVGLGGAFARGRPPVLALEECIQFRVVLAPLAQVVLEVRPQTRQVRKQTSGVDHRSPRRLLPVSSGLLRRSFLCMVPALMGIARRYSRQACQADSGCRVHSTRLP